MVEFRAVRGWCETSDGVLSYANACTSALVERVRTGTKAAYPDENSRLAVVVLEDITALGWENLISIAPSYREMELSIEGFSFGFSLTVPEDYPSSAPIIQSPHFGNPTIAWGPAMHLADIRNLVSLSVLKCKVFFQTVEDIDKHAHVVHASYRALSGPTLTDGLLRPCAAVRALLVETGVAAAAVTHCEVTILPDRPLQIPQVLLQGAGAARLKAAWDRNQEEWSPTRSFLQNMERLLEAPLAARRRDLTPMQLMDVDSSSVSAATCDICYTLEGRRGDGRDKAQDTPLPSQQPRISCKNRRCGHVYHDACIREWLLAASACKVSFGVLFGTCPYCGAGLELPA